MSSLGEYQYLIDRYLDVILQPAWKLDQLEPIIRQLELIYKKLNVIERQEVYNYQQRRYMERIGS